MPDAFFQKKRKRSGGAGGVAQKGRGKRGAEREDEGVDDAVADALDDDDLLHQYDDAPLDDDAAAAAAETPAEAKVRLARLYLEGLRDAHHEDVVEGVDAAEIDRELIAARLQKDVQETGGRQHVFVADRLAPPPPDDVLAARGHRLTVTCAASSAGATSFFSADKAGRIVQWSLRDGRALCVFPRRARHAGASGDAPRVRSRTSGAAGRRERAMQQRKMRQDTGTTHAQVPVYAGAVALAPGEGHTADIYTLAVSSDGRYLASGGRDRHIGVWSVAASPTAPVGKTQESTRWLRALTGHKDAIRTLAFRGDSPELFSASYDRTVKVFDVAQLSYIETLFGHQEAIQDLSCLRAERAVTAGGRERACRLWKIREESQLVFRGGARSKLHDLLEGGDLIHTRSSRPEVYEGSIDCVAMIDDHHFLSGSDSGSIALWSIAKKKPVFTWPAAHGFDERPVDAEGPPLPRYITSLACLPYGDVFASGSWDGRIRLWKLDGGLRAFRPLFEIAAPGIVNSLQLMTPEVERASDYPVQPALWRRRGGLDRALGEATDTEEAPAAGGKADESGGGVVRMDDAPTGTALAGATTSGGDRLAVIRRDTKGRVLGHKEGIAPLLIAGIGTEPKADRAGISLWVRHYRGEMLRPAVSSRELLSANFNQDFSCVAIGTRSGYSITNCEPFGRVYAKDDAPVGLVEMLFCTSLVAVVSLSDANNSTSPRRLQIVNTKRQSTICELVFPTAIVGVRLNRRRLIVVLDASMYVYDISNMKLLHTIESGPNPQGICALSPSSDRCFLVYTAHVPSADADRDDADVARAPACGDVVVYDLLTLTMVNVVRAHKSRIGALAVNANGSLLATASHVGTIIRVFSLPDGKLLYQFRRGTYAARVFSITFNATSTLLCVTSDTETVHLFRLTPGGAGAVPPASDPDAALTRKRKGSFLDSWRSQSATLGKNVIGSVGGYLPHTLTEMWEPARDFAFLRLPTPRVRAIAALSR
ncbi:pre-rRNA processing protein [Malassezia sp. CBS 17886]|nr:pre-rRNA processing protein [Malassezia sp. CBS 17886]